MSEQANQTFHHPQGIMSQGQHEPSYAPQPPVHDAQTTKASGSDLPARLQAFARAKCASIWNRLPDAETVLLALRQSALQLIVYGLFIGICSWATLSAGEHMMGLISSTVTKMGMDIASKDQSVGQKTTLANLQ